MKIYPLPLCNINTNMNGQRSSLIFWYFCRCFSIPKILWCNSRFRTGRYLFSSSKAIRKILLLKLALGLFLQSLRSVTILSLFSLFLYFYATSIEVSPRLWKSRLFANRFSDLVGCNSIDLLLLQSILLFSSLGFHLCSMALVLPCSIVLILPF